MAGISDAPFRDLCARFGAGLTPSEMITSDTALWTTRKTRLRLHSRRSQRPDIVQIAGYDPDMMATAAAKAASLGAAVVDINLGCPAKKVCRRAAGSALLKEPQLVARIFARVVEAAGVPVTAKIRTGWCAESRNGLDIARIAEDNGVAALTVHGRTRACKFAGQAEYETIRRIKRAVAIPVIANGDIDSAEKAHAVLAYTGADGVMIGRAARGRPWIFAELRKHFRCATTTDENLSLTSVRDIILEHLDSLYRFYGESTGVRVSRKHLAWYAEHQAGGRRFRQRVMAVETATEQLKLARDFFADEAHEACAERERSRGERRADNNKHETIIEKENQEKEIQVALDGRQEPILGHAH